MVPMGGNCTFRFIPYAGWDLDKIIVDGAEIEQSPDQYKYTYKFTNITEDHTIHVTAKKLDVPTEEPTSEPTEEPTPGPTEVTVTYTAGAVSGATVPSAATIAYGDDYTVSSYRARADGYIFNGWLNGGNAVSPGDELTDVTADTELIAQWIALPGGFVPTFSDVLALSNDLANGGEANDDYDLNGDGDIDVLDLILMAQYIADHV